MGVVVASDHFLYFQKSLTDTVSEFPIHRNRCGRNEEWKEADRIRLEVEGARLRAIKVRSNIDEREEDYWTR